MPAVLSASCATTLNSGAIVGDSLGNKRVIFLSVGVPLTGLFVVKEDIFVALKMLPFRHLKVPR